MKDVNKVTLMGRLGADPIKRNTKAGIPVVSFSMATSRKFKKAADLEGEPLQEETQWHRVVVWGKQGELCDQYLRKGNQVYVEGMIRSHQYNGKEGYPKMAFEIHADNVTFLGGFASRKDLAVEEVAAVAH